MPGRMIRGVAACVLLLFLTGCYETDFPVIEMGEGDEVPGLAGSFSVGDEGTVVIEDTSGARASRGYEYLMYAQNGDELELRADSIRDGFWLVQLGRVGDDGAMRYLFLFLGKNGSEFVFKIPNLADKNGAARKLAAAHGVEIVDEQSADSNEIRIRLLGPRDNIHAFLRANPGEVTLADATPMVPQ